MEARCYQALVVLLPECNRARTQWASTGPVLLYFPFPAITPGAPGFRLQVKAGSPGSEDHGLLRHIPRWRCKFHAYSRG